MSSKLRLALKGLNLTISQRNALVVTIYKDYGSCEWSPFCFCQKNGPSLPKFCHPDVHRTRQQSAPESEELRWVHSGYKLNKQSGLWETKEDCLVFPGFLANPIFQLLYSFTNYSALNCFVFRSLRPPPSECLEHLQLDFIQMPLSMDDSYVLIVTCTFPKWVDAVPCHKSDDFTVAPQKMCFPLELYSAQFLVNEALT